MGKRRYAVLCGVVATFFGVWSCVGDEPKVSPGSPPAESDASGGDGSQIVPEDAQPGTDGSSTTDASADASPIDASVDPSTIAGLKVWLVSSKGVTLSGTNVTKWADQSINGIDALLTNPPSEPTILPAALPNGKDAVSFGQTGQGGALLVFSAPQLLAPDSSDYLFGAVVRTRRETNGYAMLFNTRVRVVLAYPQRGITVFHNATEMLSTTAVSNDDKWHRLVVRRSGPTLEIRLDGKLEATTTDAGVADPIGSDLGSYIGAGLPVARLEGDVAELFFIVGSTTPATVAGLEAHLKSANGL